MSTTASPATVVVTATDEFVPVPVTPFAASKSDHDPAAALYEDATTCIERFPVLGIIMLWAVPVSGANKYHNSTDRIPLTLVESA